MKLSTIDLPLQPYRNSRQELHNWRTQLILHSASFVLNTSHAQKLEHLDEANEDIRNLFTIVKPLTRGNGKNSQWDLYVFPLFQDFISPAYWLTLPLQVQCPYNECSWTWLHSYQGIWLAIWGSIVSVFCWKKHLTCHSCVPVLISLRFLAIATR